MKSPAAWSQSERERRLTKWAADSGVELSGLDEWQRGVVLATVTFLSFVRGVPALGRVVAYLLSHCGMGLSVEGFPGFLQGPGRYGMKLFW
jgi:hypothetical protein